MDVDDCKELLEGNTDAGDMAGVVIGVMFKVDGDGEIVEGRA